MLKVKGKAVVSLSRVRYKLVISNVENERFFDVRG